MKWYFASRVRHRKFINQLITLLEAKKHSVVYNWSKLDILKPYQENAAQTSLVAQNISLALKDVDIFVLIADEGGTDMFVELGMVIRQWLENNKIRVYIVGKHNNRSLMHFHPAIKRLETLSEVFAIECPEFLDELAIDLDILTN